MDSKLQSLLIEFLELFPNECLDNDQGRCETHFLEEDCLIKRTKYTLERIDGALYSRRYK